MPDASAHDDNMRITGYKVLPYVEVLCFSDNAGVVSLNLRAK